MKTFRFLTLLLPFLLVLLGAPTATAADSSQTQTGGTSYVYVVHGIPGADVSPDLPRSLPVDVNLSGLGCVLQDFRFGQIVGPLEVPSGTYTVTISLPGEDAEGNDGCGGTPVITQEVTLEAGETSSIVAHLDAKGGLVASKFVNDFSTPLEGLNVRLIVQHTANAPAVDLCLDRLPLLGPGLSLTVPGVTNGGQFTGDAPFGIYQLAIKPANSDDPVFGPRFRLFFPRYAYLVYAVGSLENGTFRLLQKLVRL